MFLFHLQHSSTDSVLFLFFLLPFLATSILKKSKRLKKNNVEFDRVTVFYFPRCQGFTSVPSRGGCTLGMVSKHSSSRQFTLAEFSKEQENVRRGKLEEKLKEEKLEALKWKVSEERGAGWMRSWWMLLVNWPVFK